MSPAPQADQHYKPSLHRGSFTAELEGAREELREQVERTVSSSAASDASAPALSPSHSATPDTPTTEPTSPVGDLVADSFAFAFDIDGVLIRGGRAIPEAVEAMKVLNGKNEYGIKM